MEREQSVPSSLSVYAAFLREYFRRPTSVGAIAPSSARLARRMVEWLELQDARVVVEYGPGTGVLTEAIIRDKPSTCAYVGIEVNPVMASMFRERFPGLKLHEASVADVRKVCDAEGISQVDCIVSGLPWASFSAGDQERYLDAMMSVLKAGGQFVTFAYLQGLILPAGMRFRRRLGRYFRHVSTSGIEWGNLPPALVYRCRR